VQVLWRLNHGFDWIELYCCASAARRGHEAYHFSAKVGLSVADSPSAMRSSY
jgi:hypothetical protein